MAKAKPTEVAAVSTAPRLLTWREGLNVALVGLVVGLLTLALYYMLDTYVFTPGLCYGLGADEARCESKEYYASALAMIIGGLGGLFALVQQRIFRPLLVVLLVTVGLWNVMILTSDMMWWVAALIVALLFAVAYAAFAWLVQLRNFYLALGVSVVVVVLMRLMIMN